MDYHDASSVSSPQYTIVCLFVDGMEAPIGSSEELKAYNAAVHLKTYEEKEMEDLDICSLIRNDATAACGYFWMWYSVWD